MTSDNFTESTSLPTHRKDARWRRSWHRKRLSQILREKKPKRLVCAWDNYFTWLWSTPTIGWLNKMITWLNKMIAWFNSMFAWLKTSKTKVAWLTTTISTANPTAWSTITWSTTMIAWWWINKNNCNYYKMIIIIIITISRCPRHFSSQSSGSDIGDFNPVPSGLATPTVIEDLVCFKATLGLYPNARPFEPSEVTSSGDR